MTLPISSLHRLRSLTLGMTPAADEHSKQIIEEILVAILRRAPQALHHLTCRFLISPWVFEVKAETLLSNWGWQSIESLLPRFNNLTNLGVDFEVQRPGKMKPGIIRAVSNILKEDILRIFLQPCMYLFLQRS